MSLPSTHVRKILSPQTTGVEPALPFGIGSFQAMLVFSSHFAGMPFSWEMPLLSGPRHWGQFSARTASGSTMTAKQARMRFTLAFLIKVAFRLFGMRRLDAAFFLSLPFRPRQGI